MPLKAHIHTQIDMQREDIYSMSTYMYVCMYIYICASSCVCIYGVQEKPINIEQNTAILDCIKRDLQAEVACMSGKSMKLYNVCTPKDT